MFKEANTNRNCTCTRYLRKILRLQYRMKIISTLIQNNKSGNIIIFVQYHIYFGNFTSNVFKVHFYLIY